LAQVKGPSHARATSSALIPQHVTMLSQQSPVPHREQAGAERPLEGKLSRPQSTGVLAPLKAKLKMLGRTAAVSRGHEGGAKLQSPTDGVDHVQAVLDRAWKHPAPRKDARCETTVLSSRYCCGRLGKSSSSGRWSMVREDASKSASKLATEPAFLAVLRDVSAPPKKTQRRYSHCLIPQEGAEQAEGLEPPLRRVPSERPRGYCRLDYGGHMADLDVRRLKMLVHKACVQLADHVLTIRERHAQEAEFLSHMANYHSLAGILFEVDTAQYYFAKWRHELEPKKYPTPEHPSAPAADCAISDLLAMLQSAVSRMEHGATKLCSSLERVVTRAADSKASPSSLGSIMKELPGLVAHLEHLFGATKRFAESQRLAFQAALSTSQPPSACSSSSREARESDGGAAATAEDTVAGAAHVMARHRKQQRPKLSPSSSPGASIPSTTAGSDGQSSSDSRASSPSWKAHGSKNAGTAECALPGCTVELLSL